MEYRWFEKVADTETVLYIFIIILIITCLHNFSNEQVNLYSNNNLTMVYKNCHKFY